MAEKKGRWVEYKGISYLFADDIPSVLLCSICLELCCDPQQAVCCGKVFCLQCVEKSQLKERKEGCPCCRQPIQTFPDKRTEQEIGSLQISCANVGRGCQEQLELRDTRKHKDTCPFELIPCSFADVGCSKTIVRRELKEHNKTEILEHLDLCRKKIANIPRLEEEILNLRTKLNSKEASKREGVMPGVTSMYAETEDITIVRCKPKGFRIEVEHFDKMFNGSISEWISPDFKVDEWHFILRLQQIYHDSHVISFDLQIVEGPSCYAIMDSQKSQVYVLGEIALLFVSKGVETTLMNPKPFQVTIPFAISNSKTMSSELTHLAQSNIPSTIHSAQQPIAICCLSLWQVRCNRKKLL
jgi:hypothetical protein